MPQKDHVHHPDVKVKVIQVDGQVRDGTPSSGRDVDGQAVGHREPGSCRRRKIELPNWVSKR